MVSPFLILNPIPPWKIAGGGYGIHWPDLDEDLSTEGLLRGLPHLGLTPNKRQFESYRLFQSLHQNCNSLRW
jgi:hypothetical protein